VRESPTAPLDGIENLTRVIHDGSKTIVIRIQGSERRGEPSRFVDEAVLEESGRIHREVWQVGAQVDAIHHAFSKRLVDHFAQSRVCLLAPPLGVERAHTEHVVTR
jgi:hypothetical protein